MTILLSQHPGFFLGLLKICNFAEKFFTSNDAGSPLSVNGTLPGTPAPHMEQLGFRLPSSHHLMSSLGVNVKPVSWLGTEVSGRISADPEIWHS